MLVLKKLTEILKNLSENNIAEVFSLKLFVINVMQKERKDKEFDCVRKLIGKGAGDFFQEGRVNLPNFSKILLKFARIQFGAI